MEQSHACYPPKPPDTDSPEPALAQRSSRSGPSCARCARRVRALLKRVSQVQILPGALRSPGKTQARSRGETGPGSKYGAETEQAHPGAPQDV